MKCPSCNKFAPLEMQDPEINSVELNADQHTVSVEARIVRNSGCCGDECKAYEFNTEAELPKEIVVKMDEIREKEKDNGEPDFGAEEGSVDQLEESGGRYAKSYFGYTLSVIITHDGNSIGEFDVQDKVAASEMEELA